jgi:hypothetical protein
MALESRKYPPCLTRFTLLFLFKISEPLFHISTTFIVWVKSGERLREPSTASELQPRKASPGLRAELIG